MCAILRYATHARDIRRNWRNAQEAEFGFGGTIFPGCELGNRHWSFGRPGKRWQRSSYSNKDFVSPIRIPEKTKLESNR